MVRRLLLGLVIGLLMGGLVAAGLVAGLHLTAFTGTGGAVLAYLTAALTGVLTGLVAGKPIWASGAKIEAGLKAFFGALLAAGLMFAIRMWVKLEVPETAITQAGGQVGDLPAVALPIIAALLGGFFELDNTGEPADAKKGESGGKKRIAAGEKTNGQAKSRVAADDDEDEAEPAAAAAPKRAKR
ncbi:MAG TPA: hypothetical protein VF765_10675 [Polyangiaceae bacterium]